MRYQPSVRLLLQVLSFMLVVGLVVGCETEVMGTLLEGVLTFPGLREIRYYRYTSPPGTCTPIRFFPPAIDYNQGDWEDKALKAYQTEGIRVVTPTGVYRALYVTEKDDTGQTKATRAQPSITRSPYEAITITGGQIRPPWEQSDGFVWERAEGDQWVRLKEPPEFVTILLTVADLSETDIKNKDSLHGRNIHFERGILELWDPECRPRHIPTPTPMATPTSRRTPSPSPSPTPSWMGVEATWTPTVVISPTPPLSQGQWRDLVFFTRPQANLPCTKVRFHIQTDEQGRPDLTKPFRLSYHGLMYELAFSPQGLRRLENALFLGSVSASKLREMISSSLETVMGWDPIWGWGVFTENLPTDSPVVNILSLLLRHHILARGEAMVTGRDVYWQEWHDPDCHPRPTPTRQQAQAVPTATSPVYTAGGPTATRSPWPTPTPGGPATTPPPPAQPTPTPTSCPSHADLRRDLAQAMQAAINERRQQYGLPPLAAQGALNRAAEAQAQYMASTGQVTHSGCGGSTPAQRAAQYGYAFALLLENVANGPESGAWVVDQWMGSAGHRCNILNESIQHVGVGAACAAGVCFYVAMFGAPAGAAASTACPAAP